MCSFKPTSYKCVPWAYDEQGQLVVGTSFKSWSSKLEERYSQLHLWFKSDVLDSVEWAYEGQKEKVVALLSEWCLIGGNGSFEGAFHQVLLNKAIGEKTMVEFIFNEQVLFNGKPSLSLAELISSIRDKFLCVDG
jgi:hypothetical protein